MRALDVLICVQSQRGLGREFWRVEAAMGKALFPQVWCLVLRGWEKKLASKEEQRMCEGVEQVSEAGRCLVIEGFVGEMGVGL